MKISDFVNSVWQNYNPGSSKPIDLDSQSDRNPHTDFMDVCEYTTAYSNDMFVKADANHDGKLTKQELTNFVAQYDTDHDGDLSQPGWLSRLFGAKGEWDAFSQQYHEISVQGNCN